MILKNIIQFSYLGGLQTSFSQNVFKFSEVLVIYYFSFHIIFEILKNGIQTDTERIKLSYTLVLPVCTDWIGVSTFKLKQMDLIVSWKRAYAGEQPGLFRC